LSDASKAHKTAVQKEYDVTDISLTGTERLAIKGVKLI
jgi:hypothetical protein